MAKREYQDQSCLEAACAGGLPGQFFMIGILHILPDPTEDMASDVLSVRLDSSGLSWEPAVASQDHFDYPSWFKCVVRDPNGTLYVGEDDGYIRFADGKSAAVNLARSGKAKGSLQCAYVRGVDDVVFGSYKGEVVQVQNDQVTVHQVGKSRFEHITACLNRIHGIGPDFMVVVGDGGNMGCYRNGRWERVRPPANVRLDAVWCRAQNEIYVGGWDEKAWRWDGADSWQPLTGEFPANEEPGGNSQGFHDFAEFQGQLYAATSRQGVQRLEGDRFVPVPKVKQEYVGRLFATNIGLVGLGGVWGIRQLAHPLRRRALACHAGKAQAHRVAAPDGHASGVQDDNASLDDTRSAMSLSITMRGQEAATVGTTPRIRCVPGKKTTISLVRGARQRLLLQRPCY